MAEKLMRYYQYVGDQSGFNGKIKLAQITRVPSTKAAIEPDSPEIVRKFQDAIKEITGKPAPAY